VIPPAGLPELLPIEVNGERREVAADCTVAGLLVELGLSGRPCAVEIDRELVPKSEHGARRLRAGEHIEIVSFVGGG
jgi:sulfur carrier protein